MTPWLTVVGLGDDGWDGLAPTGQALILAAQVVVGGQRHLDLVRGPAQKVAWPSPFAQARDLLTSFRGKNVVVLASGDPMWFGIGATLCQWFGPQAVTVVAHPGAFSLAAAQQGWALQDCLCLTIHGRPIDRLHLHLAPGQHLLILSEDGQSPAQVARLLEKAGFGPSDMAVWQHLGGPAQAVKRSSAETWVGAVADLNVIAVTCRAQAGQRVLSRVPGLPDDAFDHDGQLTKQAVRAATLAALAPLPGQVLWDVGAGCGSVAIEWMRAGGQAIAIEPRPDRAARIAANAARLGVPDLSVVMGLAPDALPFSDPDAIFVGGGVSAPGVLDACWAALKPGGRLVANSVTAEGELALLDHHKRCNGEMTRMAVSHLVGLGQFRGWEPARAVVQYVGVKP